ncbi:MAG: hypothetical protein A2014_05450 [Spirochaetes bacterium GWF1_49_6]|nr:MAG: hypothetical protein A2014_05450 [Spirochaetes bacterium GWF1_49_6]
MNYDDFRWAKEVLGISIPTTYKKIKKIYKDTVKQVHPDSSELSPETAAGETAKLNKAYDILRTYCENYRIDFSEKEFYTQVDEAVMHKRFYQDIYKKKTD